MSRKKKIPGEIRLPTKRHKWETISTHTIEEVRSWVEQPTFKSIRIKNVLTLLDNFGPQCVKCGIEGDHFERTIEKNDAIHLDLYAMDGTMITIDHILPISKGGKRGWIGNMQLMCKVCNETKADTIEGG